MLRFPVATLLMLTCGFAAVRPAEAGLADAPGADLEVSLITYGPGDIYWERFGHNALQIRDTASGQAADFNYGIFDFDERGFLLNFARGYMHYMIDAVRSDLDEKPYLEAGRSVTRQRLALNAAQAQKLRDFLLWNLLPENVRYDYDYLLDNCSTRVRDALNRVLDGRLRPLLSRRPGGMTYRGQVDRLMSAQLWLMLPMDLGLGPFADRPISAWQESFLPVILQDQLRSVRVDDGGASRPLVAEERLIAPNRLPDPPPALPPDLRLPLALTGIVVAALLVLLRRRVPPACAALGLLYTALAGVTGLFLLGLWTLTMHHAAWANANLLLFNPLAFAFMAPIWRSARGAAPTRPTAILIALQLIALLLAVVLHLIPAAQQNQPWLLFALPIWCAVAWCLRGRS